MGAQCQKSCHEPEYHYEDEVPNGVELIRSMSKVNDNLFEALCRKEIDYSVAERKSIS